MRQGLRSTRHLQQAGARHDLLVLERQRREGGAVQIGKKSDSSASHSHHHQHHHRDIAPSPCTDRSVSSPPSLFPTASHAPAAVHPPQSIEATAVDASSAAPAANPRIALPPRQPIYPGAPTTLAPGRRPSRRNSLLRRGFGSPPDSFLQSPFRTRGAAAFAAGRPLRRLSAPRLWNPTNSTPRTPTTPTRRRRRPSTPPPPAVPLAHPTAEPGEPTGENAHSSSDYPLLTLPEQHKNLHQPSSRASLQIERNAGSEQRISLPLSVRHSYDEKRVSHTPSPEAGPSTQGVSDALKALEAGQYERPRQVAVGLSFGGGHRDDKGKGKEIMSPTEEPRDDDGRGGGGGFSHDLERGPGPDVLNNRHSTGSQLSGIGSAISSSNSSIMGEDQQPDTGEEWGPQHPCYPHLNPHVPVDSPEYASTRIIRIRRDWLLEGDLAPTFSNLYPEILDPAGVNEQEFRRIIEKLNSELVPAFSPYSWRNILDGVLGLATGWLWDDFGFTAVKTRLRNLERWVEQWNLEMEKTFSADESTIPPRIVPLRRTGYMTLDIQIPDPEIAPAPPSTPGASRQGMAEESPTTPTA
ncbi:Golgin subfamily A member 7/ERF4 family-domain-containing protein [Echria macrotheca]|uniref:Ras modification protein ERF4 n=1 Tax=Echria macrotheca TaxID=438768 RepID=A0AAJ0B5U6_9PEZI|nr:Golgin subfamily A member 7/ERF4 family-domain-containing protein [Echria macrotheca]